MKNSSYRKAKAHIDHSEKTLRKNTDSQRSLGKSQSSAMSKRMFYDAPKSKSIFMEQDLEDEEAMLIGHYATKFHKKASVEVSNLPQEVKYIGNEHDVR